MQSYIAVKLSSDVDGLIRATIGNKVMHVAYYPRQNILELFVPNGIDNIINIEGGEVK